MYEKSCEIIYSMISTRIKKRRDCLNLTNNEICPDADPSLMSAIVNNRRDNKKNKYLIPKGAIQDNYTPFIQTISSNLNYSSPLQLLVGTEEEIKAYSGFLFNQLILDALEEEATSVINTIEDILSDYAPYAIISSYYNAKEEHGDIVNFLIDDSKIKSFESDTIEKSRAIASIYSYVIFDFHQLIPTIFENQQDTIKLNKRLSEFVTSKLLALLINNRRTNPFISDAKLNLKNAYNTLVNYEYYTESLSPEAIGYHENDTEQFNRENIYAWFNELFEYVYRLAKLQRKFYKSPDVSLLKNKWSSEFCL